MRLTIFIYMIGCALFSIIATVKMAYCLLRGDHVKAKQIALQADDMANVALNGDADIKISTRIYLNYQKNPFDQKNRLWLWLVDGIFQVLFDEREHCYKSYLKEKHKLKG